MTQRDPDPTSVNFVMKAVEMFTDQYGYSKAMHEELFRLHEDRNRRAREDTPRLRSGGVESSGLDVNRFLVGTEEPAAKRGSVDRQGRPPRFLKA